MPNSNCGSSNSFAWFSILISIAALVIAALTYFREPARDSEKLTLDVIRQAYSDFLQMTSQRSSQPLQSHLYELPENYRSAVSFVRTAAGKRLKSHEDVSRLLLEERANADWIFTMYEQSFFQWKHARERGDDKRALFLEDVLKYFTEKLLRNPRLMWLWSVDGGRLSLHYEKVTLEHYEKSIPAKAMDQDKLGPFCTEVSWPICTRR